MAQADDLVEIALSRYCLGSDDSGEPFAVRRYGSCVATMLRGTRSSLRAELAHAYYSAHKKTPSSNALADALAVIEGRCMESQPETLHLRVARVADDIHLDLGNSIDGEDQGFVWIKTEGTWGLMPTAPVLFRRTNLTGSMQTPAVNGDVERLREFVNLSEAQFRLFVAWLIAGFFEDIPHPVLVIGGSQGVGKSTVAQIAIDLLDPSPAPLWSTPRGETDFAVNAAGKYCFAYDNLSGLPAWLSDALCRTVTGDGHVRRKLYTNGELTVNHFRRVVILNGIDPGVIRGDLIDRSLFLELDPITSDRRRRDRDIQRQFRLAAPEILGGLMNMTAMTLMTLPSVVLDSSPRMADFAQILACVDQVTGWDTYSTYLSKSKDAQTDAIDSDQVAGAIVTLMDRQESWTGTASHLYQAITPAPTPRDWPATPTTLSKRLTRATPALATTGISISRERTNDQRTIHIKKRTGASSPASLPSSPRVPPRESMDEAVATVMELFPSAEEVDQVTTP